MPAIPREAGGPHDQPHYPQRRKAGPLVTTDAIPFEADYITRRERQALVAVCAGARSVREVQKACRVESSSTAYVALQRLRHLGLVAWENGKDGTLRPLVMIVPVLG